MCLKELPTLTLDGYFYVLYLEALSGKNKELEATYSSCLTLNIPELLEKPCLCFQWRCSCLMYEYSLRGDWWRPLFQRKLCCQRGCSNSHCLWVRSSMFFDLNVAPLTGHSHPERRRSMKSLLFGWRAFTLTVLVPRLCKGQPVSLALCVMPASEDQLLCRHSGREMSACLTNLQKPQRWVDFNLWTASAVKQKGGVFSQLISTSE